jgi:hypothetical protein
MIEGQRKRILIASSRLNSPLERGERERSILLGLFGEQSGKEKKKQAVVMFIIYRSYFKPIGFGQY